MNRQENSGVCEESLDLLEAYLDGDLPGAYGRVKPGPYVRVSVADRRS